MSGQLHGLQEGQAQKVNMSRGVALRAQIPAGPKPAAAVCPCHPMFALFVTASCSPGWPGTGCVAKDDLEVLTSCIYFLSAGITVRAGASQHLLKMFPLP